jgi:hypothetical protein
MQEDACTCAILIMEVHFCLKAEMKEVGLGKIKDFAGIIPLGNLDQNDGVETWDCQFEDVPQIAIPIF